MKLDERLADDSAFGPWLVDAADFPAGATTSEVLAFAVRYAILAPSTNNTQPWLFRVGDAAVDVILDVSRGLAVSDPHDREGVISVGAAVENLRIALLHFGYASTLEPYPDPADPELCARVRLAGDAQEPLGNAELFAQIPHRRTSRMPFTDTPLPESQIGALSAEAAACGARLTVATTLEQKAKLAALIARADREQMRDPTFRRELAAWLRSNASRRADGLRGYRLGLNEVRSMMDPLVVRAFDVGAGRAARDEELAQLSPALAVLWSDSDDQLAWLATGRALSRALLRARALDLWAGFLDQPIEVAQLRLEVAQAARIVGYPQLILRLGQGETPPPQPRRPVAEVLI